MNLYEFSTQNERLLMTTAKTDVTVRNETYLATDGLKRGRYSLDSVLRKNNIDVTFPGDHSFARNFIHPTTLTLEVSIKTMSGVPFYRGRLIMVDYAENNTIILRFEPIIRLARRTFGERRVYQIHCPYVIYGANCSAQRRQHRVVVTEVPDPRQLRVKYTTIIPNNDARSDDLKFNVLQTNSFPHFNYVNVGRLAGGLLSNIRINEEGFKEWWITRVESPEAVGQDVSFTLFINFPHQFEVNDTVYVSFGCKQTISDCRDTHNNAVNFGGFPTMKKISPFEGGLSSS